MYPVALNRSWNSWTVPLLFLTGLKWTLLLPPMVALSTNVIRVLVLGNESLAFVLIYLL